MVEEGGPRHLLLLVCWKRMEGCALRAREGVQAPCDRGCCSAGVTGIVENTPIRKQVPADPPMRRRGWAPVLEMGQGWAGLLRGRRGQELVGRKSIQSESWVPGIQPTEQFGVKPDLA